MIKTRVVLDNPKEAYRIQVLDGIVFFKRWRFLGFNERGGYELDRDKIRKFVECNTLDNAELTCEEYLLSRYPKIKCDLEKPNWVPVSSNITIAHVIKKREISNGN